MKPLRENRAWGKGPRVQAVARVFDEFQDDRATQSGFGGEMARLAFEFAGEADYLDENVDPRILDQAYDEANEDIWKTLKDRLGWPVTRENVVEAVASLQSRVKEVEANAKAMQLEIDDLKEMLMNAYVAKHGCEDEEGNSPLVLRIAPKID